MKRLYHKSHTSFRRTLLRLVVLLFEQFSFAIGHQLGHLGRVLFVPVLIETRSHQSSLVAEDVSATKQGHSQLFVLNVPNVHGGLAHRTRPIT